MGIALLAIGALVSLGGWGVLLTGYGLEGQASAALSYMPSTPSIDVGRVALVQQLILLGYLLVTLGAIAIATSRISRLFSELDHDVPAAAVAHAPVAKTPAAVQPSAPLQPVHVDETRPDEPDSAAGFAQVVQEGEVEGRHFIEYDNGVVDVQTITGWRRFDTLEEAVEQLRRER